MAEVSLRLWNSDLWRGVLSSTRCFFAVPEPWSALLSFTPAPRAGSIFVWTWCNLAPFQALWQPSQFSFSICPASPGFPSEALILLWQPNALYFIFSPGHAHRMEKSREIVHFLNRSCFQFSHSCYTFQKWDGSQDRWPSSDYFKPQSHKNKSKITQSSRGHMQSRATGFRESVTPDLWGHRVSQLWSFLVNKTPSVQLLCWCFRPNLAPCSAAALKKYSPWWLQGTYMNICYYYQNLYQEKLCSPVCQSANCNHSIV